MAVRKKKPAIAGRRVGTKRRDMRWEAPDGTVWASRFEYSIWERLRRTARAQRGIDPFAYTSAVKHGRCKSCGSAEVVQDRTYTPDFFVRDPSGRTADSGGYYIEAKGYLRAEKRRLLREFRKARPTIDLRLVVERDYKVTKSTSILEWARKYLKCPAVVWTGELPEGW